MIIRCALAAALIASLPGASLHATADVDAAERQYRIARRLAAEGSAQAGDALRAVIEAAPDGPLADDARTDLAILLGAPGDLAEVGRLSVESRDRAEELLRAASASGGDRAAEARVRAALTRLEPFADRNPAAARVELLAVATDPGSGPWGVRARAVIADLEYADGRIDRARAAWQRIVVDLADGPDARDARDGLARIAMYEGRFADAVTLLAGRAAGDPLLERAVRGELRRAGAGGRWNAASAVTVAVTGMRGASVLASAPDGGVLVADRKSDAAVAFDAAGAERGRWSLKGPEAAVYGPRGRAWVVADGKVARLDAGGATAVASTENFGAVSAIAVDRAGTIYVLDRKGVRVGSIAPGALGPETFWEGDGVRLADLVWDGRRLVGADEKGGRLLAIERSGSARPFADAVLERPTRLAVDPSGEIAALDDKADAIVLVDPNGVERDRVAVAVTGAGRVAGIALGHDGALVILDGGSGRVVRLP